MHLPSFSVILRAAILPLGLQAIRLDLRQTFYSLRLHPKAAHVSTFGFQGTKYRFNHLPNEITRPTAQLATLLWVHVDDIILIAPPHEITDLCQQLCTAITNAGFVINETKSQLTPTSRIRYLGIDIDMTKRCFRPTQAHLSALRLLYHQRHRRFTPQQQKTVQGYLAFLLSLTVRQYATLRLSIPLTLQLLWTTWHIQGLAIPLRPPRKPPPVYVDATPTSIAYYDPSTNTAECELRSGHQAHNELIALLWAHRRFGANRVYITDATANLCLQKRSAFAFGAKLALALTNAQVSFTPSKQNLADPYSRNRPGIYRGTRPTCCASSLTTRL